jgi:Outer membrane protein beta-barrel domain
MRTLSAAVVVALLAPAVARAAGAEEWQLSARLGVGDLHIDGRSPLGIGGAIELEYGFSDAWAVRLMAAESAHSVDAEMPPMMPQLPGGWARATSLLGGVTYTFDVLRMVPYAQLGIGYVRFGGAVRETRTELAGELGLGADYWLTRRWAMGVVLQYLFAPVDLFEHLGELGKSPFAFSLGWRASRLF